MIFLILVAPLCLAQSPLIITKQGNQFSSTSGYYATSSHCFPPETCSWVEGNQVIVGVYYSDYNTWGGTVRWDFNIDTPLQDIKKVEVIVEWPHFYGKGLHSPSSSGSGSISVKSEGNTIATLNTNVETCSPTYDWYAHVCGAWSLKYDIPLNLIEPTTKVYVKAGSKTAWDVMQVKLLIYIEQCTSGPCCDTSTKKFKSNGAQPIGYTDDKDGYCSGSSSPTGTNYVKTIDYYCNGNDADMHSTDTTVDVCGTCEYCTDNDLTCNDYSSSTSCGTCKLCNGAGSCSITPSDDNSCGTIDCTNWYLQTGTESAQDTEYCYNKKDITSNRCEGFGDCKDPNTADCNSQANDALQYSCGLCKYITQSSCTGTTLESCSNYQGGTSCGTNKECDGNGNCADLQCAGTDTSCGSYPSCANCNSDDGCLGNDYLNYYCASNPEGCSYTSDNCNDCSCSCGNYNQPEGNFCTDNKDNDCDGLTDSADPDCCDDECSSGQKRCNGDYKQTCGNYDADPCLEWGGDVYCLHGCSDDECIESRDITIENGKIYIKGNEFLVKGVDYTPWFSGTGPDPYWHDPLPEEYDDVTDKVTYWGTVYVADYSGDGRIQAWEVIQHDMETIKGIGANTIRTYASGEWHDKNLNGNIDISGSPEQNEMVQGDLPNWMLDRIVDFCESNDMMVIIGYWIQEENFEDEDLVEVGYQLECDWDDLEVAKDTLKRVVERYSSNSAVLAWAIGNEVHGSWNHGWFTWTVDINDYLNSLFSYVRSIDTYNKPIMYAKYIGENTDFNTLTAEIIAPNAYTYSADWVVSLGEFDIPAPNGKAYLLGEFGHIIDHAEGHWNLSQQYAGGCFLEYEDVWWKGGDQAQLGLVEEYRAKKPERYDIIYYLYHDDLRREFTIKLTKGYNLISSPIKPLKNSIKELFKSIDYDSIFYYNDTWYYYFDEINNNFNTITKTIGIYINSLSDQTLTIKGIEFEYPVSFELNQGWNLIGYPSLNVSLINETLNTSKIDSILMYNNSKWYSYNSEKPSQLNTLNKFIPGYGYWVNKK